MRLRLERRLRSRCRNVEFSPIERRQSLLPVQGLTELPCPGAASTLLHLDRLQIMDVLPTSPTMLRAYAHKAPSQVVQPHGLRLTR